MYDPLRPLPRGEDDDVRIPGGLPGSCQVASSPPPPPPPSESEEDEPPPPPPPKLKRERTTNRKPRVEPEPLTPPSYLEILTQGLKEQRAKQYAEKVAQYDRFFQW